MNKQLMKESGMNDTDYFNRNNSANKGKQRPEMRRKTMNSSGKNSTVENKLLESSLVTDARQLNISQQNSSASPSAPTSINLQNSDIVGAANATREKLLITGDDVLIEYVHRLMIAV